MPQATSSLSPASKRPRLKPNPFISLRDPITGKWRVIFGFTGSTSLNSEPSAYSKAEEAASMSKTAMSKTASLQH